MQYSFKLKSVDFFEQFQNQSRNNTHGTPSCVLHANPPSLNLRELSLASPHLLGPRYLIICQSKGISRLSRSRLFVVHVFFIFFILLGVAAADKAKLSPSPLFYYHPAGGPASPQSAESITLPLLRAAWTGSTVTELLLTDPDCGFCPVASEGFCFFFSGKTKMSFRGVVSCTQIYIYIYVYSELQRETRASVNVKC